MGLKCHKRIGDKMRVNPFGLIPSSIKRVTLLCSALNSSLKVLHTPIWLKSANHTRISPPVTEPSTASFLEGIHLSWANLAAGCISFISAQHKAPGIMCQLAHFRGSVRVLSGSLTAWAGAFYLVAGEMIQIGQNRIIAAGIAIPCQGFFFASKSKKGLHRGNRLFFLLLYAPLSAFRTSKTCNPGNLTCSRGPVLYSLVLDTCFTKCVCGCYCEQRYAENYKMVICKEMNM